MNKPKIDVAKVIADFDKDMNEMSELKKEDLDITKQEAKELLRELEILEVFALKIKEENG